MPDFPVTIDTALAEFRASLGISMPQQLREAFLTHRDLAGEAIEFCKRRGVSESPARIVASLLGVGPHRFHHLEPNLSRVFQGDIDTLGDMIDRDTRSTHAAHAGGEAGFPPYPAYLYHQRKHFSLEAIEYRTGEWRYWHLTTLRQHLMDRLEGRFVALASAQVPRATHRVSLGSDHVELLDVTCSAREDAVSRRLTLYGRRLAFSLVDEALANPETIPGRVGISSPGPDDFGTEEEPTGTWTLALTNEDDAALIRCEDIDASANSLGVFSLSDWARGVVRHAISKAEVMLAQETVRLRDELKELQGPAEPRRMVVDASLADLFEEARRQSAVVALDDGAV